MKIVSHYGIHWTDEGVAFLEQGRSGANAVGLKLRSPFQVQLSSRRRHCNHQISLASPVPSNLHWDYMMQLICDDLLRTMLPILKLDGGVYFVEECKNLTTILAALARMSSPIHNIVIPMWTIESPAVIISELHATNVQPLIIVGIEPKHSSLVADISKAATILPRKLILSGPSTVIVPPEAKRITTQLCNPELINVQDFISLPWEQLGAAIVRKYMRRELQLPRSDERTGQTAA